MAADSDKAKAHEIREKLTELLDPVIAYLDELQKENFSVRYNIGSNPKTNKLELGPIEISKSIPL